jgi:SecD/SecF fusion protein
MNNRSSTGILVLVSLLASLLYLWQPWNTTGSPPLKLGLDLQGGLRVVLQAEGPTPSLEDLQTARQVIENRVNQFGVSEPLVQTSGQNRIVIELPGLSSEEQDRAQDLIGQQAVLEFRLVRPEAANKSDLELTDADLEPAAFTGEIISNSQTSYDQFGRPVISFQIRNQSAGAFGDFTSSNIGRRMAIVLDDSVVSAPSINSRISNDGQITGQFTVEEASDLSLVLRSGSLPISLQIEEIRAIGPSLGADSIRAGAVAGGVGTLAIVVTILLYYGPLFGGVLTVGVIFAMLLIFGILAGLGATLTLPGLAGLVLTIGAAVDGNVISFERIKEELRAGKSLRLAMKSGFSNSLPAIIDANVTTLFAAAALYQYTSGPVRGFAITLAIGIVASVFVNTIVVPFLLSLLTARFQRPWLAQRIHVSGVSFVKRAPIVMSLSGVLAVISLVLVFVPGLRLSTDFTGGTTVLLSASQGTTVDDVRSALDTLGYPEVSGARATIQEVQSEADREEIAVRVGLLETSRQQAFPNELAEAVGNSTVLQTEFVGPAVGEDLRTGAWIAMAVAFGLILLYVGWRFWPNWIVAVASILASIHDVGIVLGVLVLVGAEFSIPVLAALLFVVGYSLNDSIIIADRIRENLRTTKSSNYAEIVDTAVNQTLSRTIMTSFTTLLPVLALFFLGGPVLRDFSLTLLIGIGFGIYSSIFVLAPMIVWFRNRQQSGRRPLTRGNA